MTRLFSMFLLACTWVLLFGLLSPAEGRATEIEWRSGPELQQHLQLPASVTWKGASLRNALTSLSQAHRVAIFLDRRIDPDRSVEFHGEAVPLEQLLRQLAIQLEAEMTVLPSLVYIGPPAAGERLATVIALHRENLRHLGRDAQAFARRRPIAWPMLAEPRGLVKQLAAEANLELVNPQRVPHDLWPQVALPAMNWIERMSLVLAGFDLTFELDMPTQQLRVVEMPERPSIGRWYLRRRLPDSLLETLRGRWPDAAIRIEGERVWVDGSVGVHDAVRQAVEGRPRQVPATPLETRYTLRIENQPAQTVLAAVAERLSLPLHITDEARSATQQRISFSVMEATREELLDAICSPIGLRATVQEETLTIEPR